MINKTNVKECLTFVKRREKARILKEKDEPYTLDEAIVKYRFTNINKWDDKTSKLFLERAQLSDEPRRECLLAIFFKYNNYKSMPIDKEGIIKYLVEGKAQRTSAYLLGGIKWQDQCDLLAEVISAGDYSFDTIKDMRGIGSFLFNQYISNVRKLEGMYLDFYLPGPGTKRGFELIFGRPYSSDNDILLMKQLLIKNLPKHYHVYFDDINNVGNVLCEYSKYHKINKMLSSGEKCKVRLYEPNSI